MVVRNMEIFFGIKLNVAIKVRMTDAKTIAKHFGEEFVATPGFDGRVLGFAQKDSSGYSLYIDVYKRQVKNWIRRMIHRDLC